MRRWIATCVVLGLGVAVVRSDQQTAPPGQAPVFKSRVDLVHLDVAVLDRERRPVRGLMPADFTILENGVPHQVAVFSAIEIPDVEPPATAWLRDVAPDVRTNEGVDQRRLFLIIVDDAMIEANSYALKQIREITAGVVDKFGPSDLGAVVFTMDNRKSVDFTDDRARLLTTIKTQPMGFRGMGDDWLYLRYSVSTLKAAIDALATMTDRRRAVIYVGGGVPVDLEVAASIPQLGLNTVGAPSAAAESATHSQLVQIMSEAFRVASRANVSVYTLDVCGLRVDTLTPASRAFPPTCMPGLEVDYLRTVAAATGGRAVVDTNDFKPGLDAIFVENASYYLIGYQSTDQKQDGKIRRLEVKVNRPGVSVRTRSGYISEKTADVEKRRAALAKDPLGAALSGVLPKGDLPMSLTAVPFAVPGRKEAAVAIMLGIRQPIREVGARTIENVDLQVGAYNTDGKSFGATRLKAAVTLRAGATGLAEYEVLARLNLKPGRYQLRTAVNVGALSASGSLYYDIDVPDFMDEPLSMSGLVLSVAPGVPVAPKDALKNVIPVVPTTRRTFTSSNEVLGFVRVYQGGSKPAVNVPLHVRLRNQDNATVVERRDELSASAFGPMRFADFTITLPIARLAEGEYLLSVESTAGKASANRELRFRMVR